ncbi:Ig-like domain-containing protein [Dokdonia donghaensis]|nr:Ig-like domain-containing protein [Dokdonia donghaensis]
MLLLIGVFGVLGTFKMHSQVLGQQEAAITQNVTFQWEDEQDVNLNGDIDNTENNRSATIQSVTVGSDVFNTFVAPSGYQLTRLGGSGNIITRHNRNGIVLNRTTPPFSGEVIGTSVSATNDPTDVVSAWDNAALAAFQDKNLNHYFTSNGNGQNICGNFSGIVDTGVSQIQTLFYDPPIPSNADGIIAVTERGGNNCFYIRFYGTQLGSTTETILGDTFVRTSGDLRGGDGPNPPAPGSDYWESDREIENGQSIAIALFELNSVAPTGSKITRVEFVAASSDDGDGKLFILQKYAVNQVEVGCLDEPFDGNIDLSNNVPEGSTYSVATSPSPAGTSFNLNSDGTFSYTPPAGYTGDVVFEYQVCLPAPNTNVCDTATVTLTYVMPPDPAIVDLDCNTDGTTNIIITSPLGNQLEYSIDGINFQSSTAFNNLQEGDYTVTVRDSDTGCIQSSASDITLENIEVETPIEVMPVSCFDGMDGTIDLEPSGGLAPYTYLWSNGATTQDISGLAAGTYSVVVTDSYGCTFEIDAIVTQPTNPLSATADTTNVACFGESTGGIDLAPEGGTEPYTFVWSNGATTEDISNLEAGSYTVTVVDANSCEVEGTFSVEQPAAALSVADTITNVLCNGDSSGVVQLTVSGGTAPYTYEWSDGSTAANLEDVAAGSYSVLVTDANGCEIQQSFTITEPDSPLSINLTRENATTAQNCADGTATAAVTGGTAPYSYLWSNGATVASISDLSVGTYSVTVTDANDCELTQSVVVDCINTCDAVIAIGTVIDVLCASEETGSTTVGASSEANPDALFTFTWSNGEVDAGVTSSTLNNIGAGVYTVSVTIDGTVCQPVEQSVTVSEPSSAVGVTISTEDETGPGLSNGEATASATGGVAPYTYSWSNGATTAQIDNLSPGDYTVEVTDDNGCTVESTVTINPGSCNNLSITTSVENVTCNGFSDGFVGSNTTGGVGPFTYSWSNGATTENINNVEAGNYTVTVTDTFTNCTAQSTVAVNEPTVLSAGIAVNNVLCFGESTGSLNLTVSGGTLDYTYEWSSGQTIEDLTGLPAGSYSVVVTDGNGCTTTASAVINEPTSAVTADVSSTNENGATSNDGTATAIPEGGTPPYTISWSNGETTETISGLDAGDYTVVITDANGCRYEETINVASTNQVPAPVNDSATTSEDTAVEIDVTDNDNFGSDGPNDSVIVITEQPDNGTVTVDDGGTPNDPTDDAVIYTPDPDFNGTDTFEYEITDSNGDSETATVVVTVTPEADVVDDAETTPEDTPVVIDVLDNDGFDPAADVEVTDVTDPANGTVVINDDGTVTYTPNPDFNGEDTFEYTVTVTNPDGTTTTETATVVVTVTPEADVVDDAETTPEDTPVVIDVLDNDGFDPAADVEVTDVTDPANGTVVINDDGTVTYTPDPDFNGEDTFEYTVTVTNPDGTTTTETATVVVTVTPEADVVDDAETTPEDTPVVIDVLDNDGFDPAADVEVTDVTDPANGTVVINDDGTVTYTPDPDFNGEDTFEYTVTVTNPDGTTTTETATVVVTVTPEADVVDDAETTPEDTPVVIDVLDNDGFDPAADVEVTDVTDPANGTVVINDDGTVTYTPDPDFNGEDTFEYTVTVTNPDGTTTTETATVVVTVTPEADVVDDAETTPEDTPVVIDVLDNDGFDPAADVEVTDVTDPANGTVVINDDGTVTYTPDPDFNGEDTFEYTVTVTNPDGTTTTETATVVVTVTPEADVVDDAETTPEDTPVVIDVLDNDGFDPAADVEVTDVTDPANGTVVINDDGTVTYTPDPDFNGEDTFEYTVTVTNPDGTTTTETATVVVTVTPEADVVDDAETTPEDTPVVIDVLDNDGFDPAADVEVTDVTDPANGTVVINDDGTVTYTPDPDFNGEDTFEYTVTVTNPDGTTTTETATVVVTVTPEADVVDDAETTPEDTPVVIDVLDNDGFDPAADVEVTDVTDPANGTVVINDDGTVTYTPDPDFNGEDTFEYTVTVTNPDGTTTTETATVVVTVTPEADVVDDAETTPEDTPVVIDVLDNDGFDPAADVEVTDVTDPANGTVVINDDGTVTYTPDPDFNGEDTFEYTVTVTNPDGTTTTETATVVVTVTPEADVVDDAETTPEDTPVVIDVLDNDGFDPAADVEVTDVTDPANGTVVINDDGTVTYTPDPDFNGEDTFEYTVTVTNPDGTTTTETATVVVTVTPEADVVDDAETTPEDTPVVIDVLDNDGFDPAADVEVTDVTDPANGTVVINDDGTVTYTPDPDFNGEDTFEYTVTVTNPDGTTTTETATVVVTVTPEADVVDDAETTPEDTPVVIDVLDNDGFDPAADVEVTDVTDPANGTVVINDDGTVTYTPDPDFNGEDTFEYTVTVTNPDGTTTTETATVVVTVTPEADVVDDAETTPEDTPVVIDVLDNDGFDPAADVEVTDVTDPANGNVVINDDGTVTYTPDPDFNGEDTFEYTVTVTNPDGTTTTETATVVVTVTPEADVVDDAETTPEDTPVVIDVLDNDGFDPAADVEVTDVTDPANGTVVINDDGTVTYTPDPDFNGEDTFEYTVTVTNPDGTTTTETATVVVTVTPEADVVDDAETTPEDTPVVIDVLDNDGFDPAADVEVTDVTDPANGTVVINDDGTVTYTPDPDFNGEDTFEYTVTVTNPDGTTTTETATVVVTVTPEADVVDDAETTPEDTPVVIDVLDNDGFDPAADVEVTDVTDPANGTVVINDDGTVTYTPDPDFNGEDTFEYTVTVTNPDGTTTTETATVVVTVTPEADVVDDAETTPEDTPVVIDVLDNDGFDPAADVEVTDVTDPANGTVVINDDGTVTYTPDPNFNGEDTFEYTVTVTNPDGTTTTETATVVVTVTPDNPSLDVFKEGNYEDTNEDGVVNLGDSIIYNFIVFNNGDVPLSDITLTDELVDVMGGPIDLGVGESDSMTFTAIYAITQEDINTGAVYNQAIATGQDPAGEIATDASEDPTGIDPNNPLNDPDCMECTITVLNQDPEIAIVKTGMFNDENGDGFAQEGETITYNFTVTNTGNVTVTNIIVTDPLVTVTGGPIDLVPGTSDDTTFIAEYVLTQEDVDAGMVENQALVTGQDPNGDDVVDTSDDNSTVEGEEDVTITDLPEDPGAIAIVKTGTFNDEDGDGFAQAGETITYNFTVTNTGNVTVTNIIVTDPLVTVTGGPIDLVPGAIDATTFVAEYVLTQEDVDAGMVENQALATGQNPNGDDVEDTSDDDSTVEGDDDVTITDLPEDPGAIAIVKTGTFNDEDGDGFAQVGETITYNFTVTNTGNVTVTNIIVTDPLVTVTGGPIDLVPGAIDATTFVAEYVLTQEDVDAGMVENQALATGQNPNGDDVEDTSDDDSTVEGDDDITITDLPEDPGMIAIVKTGTFNDEDGDGFAQAGETITYNFTVTNTGNVTVANIIVTDPLVTVTGGPIDLVPGAIDATTFVADYVLTQEDVDAGMVENQALATGQNPSGDDVEDTSDDDSIEEGDDDVTITDLPEDPGTIAIVKTGTFNDEDGDGFAQVGETITYNFTVTNTGNVTVANIIVTDPLVTVTGGPIDLVPGAIDATTFVAEYVLTQEDVDAGMVENQALATGQNPNGDDVEDTSDDDSTEEGDDDVTITDLPEDPGTIAIVKTGTFNDEDGDGFAQVGETITYNFTVTNTGNVTVTNINVTDPLVTVTGGPIDLVPGASDATTFVAEYVLTQEDVDAGMVENQALATGQNPSGDDVEDTSDDDSTEEGEDDVTITDLPEDIGSIAVVKTGTFNDEDGDGFAQAGETITYNFTVSNTGNVTISNIVITDPLVAVTGGPIDLEPGASDSTTFVAVYTLTQDDVDAGMVENQALATGQNPNGDDVEDTSDDDSTAEGEEDVTITILPTGANSIALEKTGELIDLNGDGVYEPGEIIQYTFTVTNTGELTIEDIVITDPLVDVEGGPITLLPGESDSTTFTATYLITEEDIENGQVLNQATVSGVLPDGTELMDLSDDPTDDTNVDVNGDGNPDDPTVTIIPSVLNVTDLEVFTGISPDGDGQNDVFIIEGIVDFPDNNVQIFNRWGVQVFEGNGYDNQTVVFKGISDGRATINSDKELPEGTYYYLINYQTEDGLKRLSGYLYINR